MKEVDRLEGNAVLLEVFLGGAVQRIFEVLHYWRQHLRYADLLIQAHMLAFKVLSKLG